VALHSGAHGDKVPPVREGAPFAEKTMGRDVAGFRRPERLALALAALAVPAALAALAFAQESGERKCAYSPERKDYRGCNFSEAELKGADLSGADLRGARLDWVRLDGANLEEANFEAPSRSMGQKPPSLYRANFKAALLIKANFRGAQLPWAHFDIADVSEADFEGANLEGVTLVNGYAVGTNFRKANLRDARMMESDFSGADFRGADLTLVDFESANLEGAKLEGAIFTGVLNPKGYRCRGNEPSLHDCVLEHHWYDRDWILLH
jgi:hypothetical protein